MRGSDIQALDAGTRSDPTDPALFAGDVVAMLDRLTDGIVVLGPDWRYRYVNEPAAAMLGRAPATLIGRHVWTEFPAAAGQPFRAAYERAMVDRQPARIVEYVPPWERWFENHIFPQGENLVIVLQDVTERQRSEQALGLSQRRIRAIVDNTPSIVVVKDLEGRYLMANSEIGRVLQVAPQELVGTECGALFAPDLATRLRANDRRAAAENRPVYDEVILVRDGEPRTYVTVTFALPDDEGRPVETCTIGTDVTDNRERETERRERDEWTQRIESALREERMLVYTQPIVDVTTGAQVSCELLVRMIDEHSGEVLPPCDFLPSAERFGVVQQIDVWMVRQALRLSGRAPHVNLSALTICDPAATRAIVELLTRAPESARTIVFEITETAAVEHLEAAIAFATEISALGCGLALDDFGTGFGSFTYLRRLPLRSMKIDMSFVAGVRSSEGDRRIVRSIIGIAEQFELDLIAEGVEDGATLELLRGMGVDFVQGFHLGRPAQL